MELADVTDSKSVGSDTVRVQVPPPAPNRKNPNQIFPRGKGFGFFIYFMNSVSEERPQSYNDITAKLEIAAVFVEMKLLTRLTSI